MTTPLALILHDESPTGQRTNTLTLTLVSERVTARELIRRRVQQEVEAFNAQRPEYYKGLVQPTHAERTLNGSRIASTRTLDWKEEYGAAVAAFARNGYFMLAGDRQIEDLDEEIVVTPGLEISFIKLVQLVGG